MYKLNITPHNYAWFVERLLVMQGWRRRFGNSLQFVGDRAADFLDLLEQRDENEAYNILIGKDNETAEPHREKLHQVHDWTARLARSLRAFDTQKELGEDRKSISVVLRNVPLEADQKLLKQLLAPFKDILKLIPGNVADDVRKEERIPHEQRGRNRIFLVGDGWEFLQNSRPKNETALKPRITLHDTAVHVALKASAPARPYRARKELADVLAAIERTSPAAPHAVKRNDPNVWQRIGKLFGLVK